MFLINNNRSRRNTYIELPTVNNQEKPISSATKYIRISVYNFTK